MISDAEVRAYLSERSEYVTESGCRVWLGPVTHGRGHGYGMLMQRRIVERFGTRYVHRISYLMAHGPLPPGKEVDHRCNVRSCIEEAHLRPLTHYENIHRATGSVVAQNMRKTHCNAGHLLDGTNLRMQFSCRRAVRETRRCKRCHADREQERRGRLRAEGYQPKWMKGRVVWMHAISGRLAPRGAGRIPRCEGDQ